MHCGPQWPGQSSRSIKMTRRRQKRQPAAINPSQTPPPVASRRWIWLACGLLAVAAVLWAGLHFGPWKTVGTDSLIETAAPHHVGSAACAECHAEQQAAWTGSHHDLAMQEATEATVLGNFKDARFAYAGVTTEFFRRDGKFVVRTDGAGRKARRFHGPLRVRGRAAAAIPDRIPGRPPAGALDRLGFPSHGARRPALVSPLSGRIHRSC